MGTVPSADECTCMYNRFVDRYWDWDPLRNDPDEDPPYEERQSCPRPDEERQSCPRPDEERQSCPDEIPSCPPSAKEPEEGNVFRTSLSSPCPGPGLYRCAACEAYTSDGERKPGPTPTDYISTDLIPFGDGICSGGICYSAHSLNAWANIGHADPVTKTPLDSRQLAAAMEADDGDACTPRRRCPCFESQCNPAACTRFPFAHGGITLDCIDEDKLFVLEQPRTKAQCTRLDGCAWDGQVCGPERGAQKQRTDCQYLPGGYCFDVDALATWAQRKTTNPMTNEEMTPAQIQQIRALGTVPPRAADEIYNPPVPGATERNLQYARRVDFLHGANLSPGARREFFATNALYPLTSGLVYVNLFGNE